MDETTAVSLTPAQRKALKAQAHHLKPVVMIGDAGLTDAVLAEADRALRVHALIKIRVLGDDRATRGALMAQVCAGLDCAPVQSIGKLLVVYRPLPEGDEATEGQAGTKRRRRGPHRPKKAAGAAAEARSSAGKAPGAGGRAPKGGKARAGRGQRSGKATAERAPSGGKAVAGRSAAPSTGRKAKAGAARTASTGAATRGTEAKRPSSRAPARAGSSARVSRLPATGPRRTTTRSASRDEPGTPERLAGGRKMATSAKKALSPKTAGKRTDLASASKPPARRGMATKATQGPEHLQGKPGPRTAGRRNRAKGGG